MAKRNTGSTASKAQKTSGTTTKKQTEVTAKKQTNAAAKKAPAKKKEEEVVEPVEISGTDITEVKEPTPAPEPVEEKEVVEPTSEEVETPTEDTSMGDDNVPEAVKEPEDQKEEPTDEQEDSSEEPVNEQEDSSEDEIEEEEAAPQSLTKEAFDRYRDIMDTTPVTGPEAIYDVLHYIVEDINQGNVDAVVKDTIEAFKEMKDTHLSLLKVSQHEFFWKHDSESRIAYSTLFSTIATLVDDPNNKRVIGKKHFLDAFTGKYAPIGTTFGKLL